MKKTDNTGRRQGAVLMVTLGFVTLCAIITGVIAFGVDTHMRQTRRMVALEQAFYLAEAGAEYGATYVADGNTDSATITGSLGSGTYRVYVDSQSKSGGSFSYDISSTGTVNGVSHVVTLRGIRRVSWARYALWYDKEVVTPIYMVPGEKFRGRVYSKPQLAFYGTSVPAADRVRFYDRVWTGASSYTRQSASAEPILDFGITFNAKAETMAPVDFAELLSLTAANMVFEGPTTIELDGTKMKVTNARKSPAWNNKLVDIPNDGIIYIRTVKSGGTTYTGNLSIKGPNGLNGRLTCVADNDITVTDHIRYKKNPLTYPDSTDTLGLIAYRDVAVGTGASNNLDIHAHVIAKTGGFGVTSYNRGSARGKLTVLGGIANDMRKAVGTAGSPGTGYIKNYIFDERLTDNPPPYYPKRENELEWSMWEG